MPNLMGYFKLPLFVDFNPTPIPSSPLQRRSLSDTFGFPRTAIAQETLSLVNFLSLPPPLLYGSVSDVPMAPPTALAGSFRCATIPEANLVNPRSSEANEYLINDGVRELDQWCNKLLKHGESVSFVKQS